MSLEYITIELHQRDGLPAAGQRYSRNISRAKIVAHVRAPRSGAGPELGTGLEAVADSVLKCPWDAAAKNHPDR